MIKIIEITVNGVTEIGPQRLWLMGDLNYDGTITTADGVAVYRHVYNKVSAFDADADRNMYDAADVNNDGNITEADAMEIFYKVAGMPSALDGR